MSLGLTAKRLSLSLSTAVFLVVGGTSVVVAFSCRRVWLGGTDR